MPPDQKAGWLIDPRIIILFVPGGCTGILQPCDVGMNRVLKQALRRAAHADVVDETMAQLDDGRQPESVKLDTTLGVLRDRSVHWMVRAFEACNNEALCPGMGGMQGRGLQPQSGLVGKLLPTARRQK